MKIHSYGKKLMAVACAVVMLVSCMVFAPVSAESKVVLQTDYTTDSTYLHEKYEGKYNGKYSNRTEASDGSAKVTYDAEADGHNSKGVMTFQWENNRVAGKDGKVSRGQIGYRLFAENYGEKLTNGKYYSAEFFYKVEKFTENAELRFFVDGRNWGDEPDRSSLIKQSEGYKVIELKATDEAQEWQRAYFTFQVNSTNPAMHLSVTIDEVTNLAGSKVLIDDVIITSLEMVTVTLDGNGGTASSATEVGLPGDAITATATRDEYIFMGWYSSKASADDLIEADKVATFPANMPTPLYAGWKRSEKSWYTVTFHANPGELTGAATAMYEVGTPITMTDPVRPGWEFLGWYTAAGDAGEKIAAVTGDVDAYAHWAKTGTVAEIDGLQSFEASANLAMKRFTWVEGEENHTFAGNGALKVAVNSVFSQRGRPRLILQSNGQDLVVEPGKSYTVSFWMRTVKNAYNAGYYLATMADNSRDGDIQKEAANQASNEKSDVHKLQTLTSTSVGTFYYGGAESTDGKGTEVGKMALKAGEWTQVTATFTAEAQVDGKPSYLALGLVSEKNGALVGCDFYIDDIQVAETDTLADVHTYEAKETGKYSYNNGEADKLAGTGNGREVTDEVMNHSFGLGGVGHTAKVTLHYKNVNGEQWAYNNYNDCITGLYNADATIREVTPGNTCLVSAWLYSATETTVGVQLYTAGSAGSWLVAPNETIATKQVALAANTWTQVTLAGAVPTITNKDGITCQYLALAFANTAENGEAGATEAVYVDDTKVQELGALKEFSGNVALYVNGNGNDARYDGQHGALRLLGGYQIADGQYDKATINGVTYTVKQRGIILANESQTNLSLFSKEGQHCIKISTAKNLAKVCWTESETKDFITYSLLLKGFSSTTADTKYNFRPYVTVDMDGEEVTFYGKLSTVSWNAAVEQYETVKGVTLDKDLVK